MRFLPAMLETRSSMPRLRDFVVVRPAFEASQSEALEWLAGLHTAAERARSAVGVGFDESAFHARIRKLLYRCGCSPDKISTRGYDIADGNHTAWSDMRIYDVSRSPHGAGALARTEAYARIAGAAVERLYAEEPRAPGDLIHVTCTGYAAPSAAQRLVARRGWGGQTRVTHAYHMGCYAALPAVRIAAGLLGTSRASGETRRADIVHNEICTLHVRPADHSPEQLVVQSLFADGHIRYSVVASEESGRTGPSPSLEVLALGERILPDSTDAMAWIASDHGMTMTLAREVPMHVATAAREFVSSMFDDAGLSFSRERAATAFAIHPGGPLIVDVVQQALELSEAQVAASRRALHRYGNMSSATLPHIWKALLEDVDLAPGTLVASLAFGPGLTVSGAVMVKR